MLGEEIEKDFLAAFKARDEMTTGVLRMVKAAIKNKEIELGKKLDDQEMIKLLSSQIKQRRDAAAEFEKGGRPELAEKEKAEEKVIVKYLPPQLSEEEIREKVKSVITELGAVTPAEMGKVMARLMPIFSGKADGALVSQIVKEELSPS